MKAFALPAVAIAAFFAFSLRTQAAHPREMALEVTYMPSTVFPHELAQRGIMTGEADVVVSITPEGRIADWLVTACTDPAVEKMAGDFIPDLQFKPLSSDGQKTPVRASLRFVFEARGVVVTHTVNDTLESIMNRGTAPRRIEKLGTRSQLDHALTPQHIVAPLYPEALRNAAGARVTLEFLIDETGRVRMPVLHEGENQLLAKAAATALVDWRFTPPTRGGKPVIISARQEFFLPPRE